MTLPRRAVFAFVAMVAAVAAAKEIGAQPSIRCQVIIKNDTGNPILLRILEADRPAHQAAPLHSQWSRLSLSDGWQDGLTLDKLHDCRRLIRYEATVLHKSTRVPVGIYLWTEPLPAGGLLAEMRRILRPADLTSNRLIR